MLQDNMRRANIISLGKPTLNWKWGTADLLGVMLEGSKLFGILNLYVLFYIKLHIDGVSLLRL